MRRQNTAAKGAPEGVDRCVRLDPFRLPATTAHRGSSVPRFRALVSRKAVTISGTGRGGVALKTRVPVKSYRGVLLSIREDGEAVRVRLHLYHQAADLCVLLFEADSTEDVVADWQAWARQFGLPMLLEEPDGTIREPVDRLGAVEIRHPRPRRANAFFRDRRPRVLSKRRTGGEPDTAFAEWREIIARN